MKTVIALFLALLFSFTAANAATKKSEKNETVFLVGEITLDVAEHITSMDPKRIKTINLYSNGGDVLSAIAIARFIRKNGIETRISKKGICYSACTMLFQAGVKRYASRSSELMYHYAYDVQTDRENQLWSIAMFTVLEEYGIKKSLIKQIRHGQEMYIDAGTSKIYNVVTNLEN